LSVSDVVVHEVLDVQIGLGKLLEKVTASIFQTLPVGTDTVPEAEVIQSVWL